MRHLTNWARAVQLLFVVLILLPKLSAAEDEARHPYLGHNLTPATQPLAAGMWTVGVFAIARGLTDNLFVATSPWLWGSYNTANVHLKWIPYVTETSRFGAFASYFESFNARPFDGGISGTSSICRVPALCNATPPPGAVINFGRPRYQWKSLSTHALASFKYLEDFETYLSAKYTYYWNDDLPYSIRMDPGSDSIRGQVDFTSLTTKKLAEPYLLGLEIGILGANYMSPYLHFGASVAYQGARWLMQAGASYTIRFSEIGQRSGWSPGQFDERLHQSKSDGDFYYFRYLQAALHPEVQLQYAF